jgi:tetrahydromethanopterin S-methyltransferase subunit F
MSITTTDDLPTRVAVLEQIAKTTQAAIERIDRRLETIENNQRSDFRWTLGIMITGYLGIIAGFTGILGVMAHGFHWI